MIDWLLDNIVPTIALALVFGTFGFFVRPRLAHLWDRRPWPPIRRSPRTEAETRRLLAVRPSGWEMLHFAGQLRRRLADAEPRYRDHEAQYVTRSATVIPLEGWDEFISSEMDSIEISIHNWTALINGGALARAMGEPGEDGDPVRIEHLAERLTSAYVELMDWSGRLLGSRRPQRYRRLVPLVARLADLPVQQYRDWVGNVVRVVDEQVDLVSRGKEVEHVDLSLTIALDEDLAAQISEEVKAIRSGARDGPDAEDDD